MDRLTAAIVGTNSQENSMKIHRESTLERENSADKNGSIILILTNDSILIFIQRGMDRKLRHGSCQTIFK